jgi:hypothetical protein
MSQTASLTESSSPAPPLAIRRALRRVDARLRSAAAGRGLGTMAIVAAVGSALGMAADFVWALPEPARWGIWGVWVATIALLVGWGVIRPLLRRSRWIDLAAVAERADPRLEERLTGSIALLDDRDRPGVSPALVDALADDAAGHAGAFDPGLVKPNGRPLRRLALGLVAVALVAAPSVARPDPFRTLALRFLAPWLDLERVGRFAIEVKPGDAIAALGADVAVEAEVSPRFGSQGPPDSASLEWTDDKGATHRARMAAKPADSPSPSRRSFEAILPRLAGNVAYRVSTDSAASRSYRVSAIDPPKSCEFSARVEPPPYTKLPASDAKDPAKIEAVEGSRVVLAFYSCVPYRDFELTWPSASPGPPLKVTGHPTDSKHATAAFEALAGGPFVLTLLHHPMHPIDGLPETRQLVVRPDAPPTLTVKGPPSPGEARPDDVLQLAVAARDDFGVASAELHYEVRRSSSEESKAGNVPLKLEGTGTPTARGVASVSLRDLGLEIGDALAYRVRVTDNRPAPKGPNEAWSDVRAIAITAKAEPMIARDDRLRRESFQARLDEARVANAANRRETEQLRYAADAAQRTGQAWDAGRDADLASREAEARAVEDKLQLLARDLQFDPTFGPLARPTRQAAEVEAEAGRAQLEQARKAPDSAKRLVELRQADARLGALGNRLDEIRRRFDALAKLDQDRQKLRDLAAKEDALAAKADKGAEEKDRLANDQDDLRKALDDLLSKSPMLRAGLLGKQAEEASKLAKEARALAEKQRAESRKTAERPRATDPLLEIARDQKELEDDARRLALDVDDPLAENGRSRLDTDAVKRAVDPIERGDLPDAVRRLEEAEDSLRRLDRDIEDVPGDPKALARRLARRQELLANDVAATLGESRQKDIKPEEKAALVERSKPLLDRQAEIARLAAGLVPPEPQKGAAREATQAVERAAENLRDFKPRESEERQNNARRTLNQLAEALADPNRIRDEARQKLNEAKRKEDEVLNDLDRHLAETRPQPDKPDADARAATDLAEKIAPLAQKQKEAAEALAKLDLEPRLIPQRDRAAARANRLARQIQAVKDQAPPRRPEPRPVPPARWTVLGPFPTVKPASPFDVSKPVDLGAEVKVDGKSYAWKPAPFEGDEGKINLGKIFDTKDNQAAFAVAEITSPARRKVPLSIGSDDSLIVWLNGKKVFEFDGSRGFTAGQDKAEVELLEGVNRLAIRCGTGNGEWGFAVNTPPPPPEGFDPSKAKALRESLASTRLDAKAALERLEQKSNGKMPADDLAAILAAEQRQAAEALAQERSKPPEEDPAPRERAAQDRKRLATALRNLPVAQEAPALQAEAVRLAELAAPIDADPKAAKAAAEAAEALARRLADAIAPRELAAALARAERALADDQADPARLADRQQAIAAEMARERSASGDQRPASQDQAEQAVRDAANLANQAKKPDPSKPAPTPAALVEAEARAAEALDKMAADPALGPDPAPSPVVAEAKKPADAAPSNVPSDPALGLGPEQASKAADLARRQRQVRERLQAAMAERVAPQQDLKRDSQALGRNMADLRDKAKELNARSQWQAHSAAELVGEQAPKAMERGAEQLAQGRLDQAREAQRQAADLVERAARDAEDFAAGLLAEAASAGDNPGNDAAKESSTGLADARESLQGISRRLSQAKPGPDAGKAAAPQMRQAAEALRAAAQAAAKTPNTPPNGETDPDNPNVTANEAGKAEADLAALQDLVRKKTGRKWGELPGHLRTEILQLSKGRYRDDYARLIQLYFREIAVDAGKSEKP